jgi:hypothetical protein
VGGQMDGKSKLSRSGNGLQRELRSLILVRNDVVIHLFESEPGAKDGDSFESQMLDALWDMNSIKAAELKVFLNKFLDFKKAKDSLLFDQASKLAVKLEYKGGIENSKKSLILQIALDKVDELRASKSDLADQQLEVFQSIYDMAKEEFLRHDNRMIDVKADDHRLKIKLVEIVD